MLRTRTRADRLLRSSLVGVCVACAATACYPLDDDDSIDDYDVVLTTHDESVDFTTFSTYAMPDTVVFIEEQGVTLSRAYDGLILSQIEDNMAARGFTRVTEATQADVVLLVAAVGGSTTWFYEWWPYWGYWPGWGYYPPVYGPGWGWGYPPSYIGSVTVEQGTITLVLVDPAPMVGTNLPILWAGAVRGVLGGATSARIESGIDQAFIQSPYLHTN